MLSLKIVITFYTQNYKSARKIYVIFSALCLISGTMAFDNSEEKGDVYKRQA